MADKATTKTALKRWWNNRLEIALYGFLCALMVTFAAWPVVVPHGFARFVSVVIGLIALCQLVLLIMIIPHLIKAGWRLLNRLWSRTIKIFAKAVAEEIRNAEK